MIDYAVYLYIHAYTIVLVGLSVLGGISACSCGGCSKTLSIIPNSLASIGLINLSLSILFSEKSNLEYSFFFIVYQTLRKKKATIAYLFFEYQVLCVWHIVHLFDL